MRLPQPDKITLRGRLFGTLFIASVVAVLTAISFALGVSQMA